MNAHYSVVMRCNPADNDKIAEELITLGYREYIETRPRKGNVIVTYTDGIFNFIDKTNASISELGNDKGKVVIEEYNHELLIALASQTLNSDKNNWFKYIDNNQLSFITGKLYKCKNMNINDNLSFLDERSRENGYSLDNSNCFTKATSDEIIKQFASKQSKINYSIKGTKLPMIPLNVPIRVSNDGWTVNDFSLRPMSFDNLVSYGISDRHDELCILVERPDYTGNMKWEIPLKTLQELANTNMKTRKEYTVTGNKYLLTALAQELLANGYTKNLWTERYDTLYVITGDDHDYEIHGSTNTKGDKSFVLPQQYDEAKACLITLFKAKSHQHTIKLEDGNIDVQIEKNNIIIDYGKETYVVKPGQLADMVENINQFNANSSAIKSWVVKLSSITIGCQEIPVLDIKKILLLYNELNEKA